MEMEGKLSVYFIVSLLILGGYLLMSLSDKSAAAHYDNTSIESRVNVTNIDPFITQVNVYEFDDGSEVSIDLSEGGTETIVCNGTVNDWNGADDIASVNATIYNSDSYNPESGQDNNYLYFTGSCTNATLNATAMEFSCSFNVWYYADNATWNCNMSAVDILSGQDSSVDVSPPTITQLAALNLSTNLIDFGEMPPGNISSDLEEQMVNVTNTGNVAINLSLDGFGTVDGDGLAMNCTVGNISVDRIRYNITANEDFTTSMWNLTDTALPSGIPGLSIVRRIDDGDTQKVNSTNSTYWKIGVPIGVRGFCNGTVTFSAVV